MANIKYNMNILLRNRVWKIWLWTLHFKIFPKRTHCCKMLSCSIQGYGHRFDANIMQVYYHKPSVISALLVVESMPFIKKYPMGIFQELSKETTIKTNAFVANGTESLTSLPLPVSGRQTY